MFFRMVYKSGQIFLPFCHNPRVWQTDGQTEGQTEISSQYRVCITCSAVKTIACIKLSQKQSNYMKTYYQIKPKCSKSKFIMYNYEHTSLI